MHNSVAQKSVDDKTMSWQYCRLGDVLTLKGGQDLPEHSRQDGAVPVVSSSGITGRHKEAKATAPGVVTGRYGTIGDLSKVDRERIKRASRELLTGV